VLASRAVYAELSSVLESVSRGELEEAKRKLQSLGPEMKTDRERGSFLAASGIYSSVAKSRAGAMQSWTPERMERAVASVTSSQMADDFDRGYADTVRSYFALILKKS
jgi:hypothetical protein